MKKIALITFITIAMLSCNPKIEECKKNNVQNALIPNELLVNYAPLIKRDSAYNIGLNVYQKNEIDIVDFVFNKVLAEGHMVNGGYIGDITNYKNDSNILLLEDIKRVLGMGPYTLSYEKNGEEVFKTFENEFVKEEIIRISFVEKWHLDENSFILTKDVLRHDFVREYERESNGPKLFTKVFGVIKNDSVDQKWEYIGSKVTETNITVLSKYDFDKMNEDLKEQIWNDFVSLDNSRNVYWNNYTYKKFVNSMFNALQKGTVIAYDLQTKKILNWLMVEERMGAGEKTISYIDESGNEVTQRIKMELVPTEIRSILFFEDWFMDKESLALKKEIKGIAPVRFYMYEHSEIVKEIPFVIWYNTNH